MYWKYEDYEAADFAADEDFKRWVRLQEHDPELDRFWADFGRRYPHKYEAMQEAKNIVRSLVPSPGVSAVGDATKVWQQVSRQITAPVRKETPQQRLRRLHTTVGVRYAAVVAVFVCAAGVAWFLSRTSVYTYTTLYGQQAEIELPDHSIVSLGANSTIRYEGDWDPSQPREIWMSGEARFDVRHLNRDTTRIEPTHRFIVHVENQVDIEVLGTTFNVRNRRGKTQVALESGAIQVRMQDKTRRLTRAGQSVEAVPSQAVLEASSPDGLAGYEGMMTMNNTRVGEILVRLEDNYGIHLQATDSALLARRVEGALPLNNREQALAALASILHVKILRQNEIIMLAPIDAVH